MAYNDKRLKTDLEGKPIPQAYNPDIDDYEPVHSTNNALKQVIYGPNGQPISTVGNKLAVRATELEALMQGLATEGKLEQVRQLLAGVATEAKLEQARGLLASISGKDFATQTTLAQVQSELALVKAELQEIKANQLSGDQKVQLSGTIVELARGGSITITAGTEYAIYSTTNFDASEVTVQVRGLGKKVDIVIKEYINNITVSRVVREETISSPDNTTYRINGRTKVFGRIFEIYLKNTLSEDVAINAWAVNAIKT